MTTTTTPRQARERTGTRYWAVELIPQYLLGAATLVFALTKWNAVRSALDSNRRLVGDLVSELLPGVGYAPPESSFLAWLDVAPAGWGDDPARALVEECRVALSPGPAFGDEGAGFVRLNMGSAPARVRDAIERMDPQHYLASSYYEKWFHAVRTLCVEKGVLTAEEVDGALLAG